MKPRLFALALSACLALSSGTAQAEFTIWFHPALATSPTSALTILPGEVAQSIVVQANTPGQHWLGLPGVFSSDVQVNSARVCYKVSNPSSFISQVRLLEMSDPSTSTVYIDDPTDLTSTTGTCVTTAGPNGGPFVPTGSIGLALLLDFSDIAHTITIGGIGINVSSPAVAVPGQSPRSSMTTRNYPNPVHPATTIEYEVTQTERVDILIFDGSGRRVRSLMSAVEPAGTHRAQWDGKDDGGHDVPTGSYFYEILLAGRESGAQKMIVMP